MDERKTCLFIFFVIIYCVYSARMWYTSTASDDLEENTPQIIVTVPDVVFKNDTEQVNQQVKKIPLYFKNACSVLDVFTKKPVVKIKNNQHKKEDMAATVTADNNAITVIGMTVFLVILTLNALLDVLKVKEEERAQKKLNPDGERRQSLAEFANRKSGRRESNKFGLQLFQIEESVSSSDDEKKSRRQSRPYTRGESTNSYLSEKRTQVDTSAPASVPETPGAEHKLVKRQSVAKLMDNKLEWLPQRPVYNYYHCEFRFWRNTTLKAIPYSLWYHMFRDQQTRSLNIGCLQVPKYQQTLEGTRFSLKFYQDSREWECDIRPPAEHSNIITNITPPSLYEISKRVLYDLISETAKNLNTKNFTTHSYNSCYIDYTNQCNKLSDLDKHLDDIKDSNGNIMNGGGNNIRRQHCFKNSNDKMIYHTADIIEENLGYLPNFMKIDLGRGPISKCENVNCKKNIFDYVLYEFILE